ncbi:MAG TPA: DoxX family protein [Planctomycetota bacterium]|nr:DoxX family protein [Planctomycetota bacterium]
MLKNVLSPLTEKSFALLRIVSGFMLSFHGMQKVLHILSTFQPSVGSQLWIGGLIELVCGILIGIGLFTREAAFLASGTMAVAYIQFHWKFQLGSALIPTINQGELAALYAWVFFLIACRGAGNWSVDERRAKKV